MMAGLFRILSTGDVEGRGLEFATMKVDVEGNAGEVDRTLQVLVM